MANIAPTGMPATNITSKERAKNWAKYFSWLLFIILAIHVCCIFLLASVPPISRDALIHHLAIPKIYLNMGGFYEIPSMHFSYFPMNLDLLYMLPLYFKNDIVPKYIHFFFAIICAILLYSYLKDKLNRVYGLIGALFFLTTPIIVKLSITAYVDLGLIFFSWASLYCFLKWYGKAFQFRYLIFSGIACGLALGTKYNGLILLVIMATLISLSYSIQTNAALPITEYKKRYANSIKGLGYGTVFVLISLILFSPWMIRNIIWKQNPLYPLYESVFNPPEIVSVNETVQKEKELPRNAFWLRRYIYNETFTQTVTIPFRMFFQGQDDNPKYFDGKLNPLLLLLPLLSFFCLRKNASELIYDRNILSIFGILFTLFVLFKADFRIRYMSPAIPALVVLSVFGLKNIVSLLSEKNTFFRNLGIGIVSLFVFLALCYNANYIRTQFSFVQPLGYIAKKINRDTYISNYRFEYPVIQYANEILPMDARVLCLSIGDRTYYIDRHVHLAEDFYDKENGIFSEFELLKKLSRSETSHIILSRNTYLDWARSLKPEERNVFENVFQKNTKLLYEKNGVLLLELKPT
ncbi:MAG: phospholipid carrier-dependent glycosyltransferase [Desulforhopalus sp.]